MHRFLIHNGKKTVTTNVVYHLFDDIVLTTCAKVKRENRLFVMSHLAMLRFVLRIVYLRRNGEYEYYYTPLDGLQYRHYA